MVWTSISALQTLLPCSFRRVETERFKRDAKALKNNDLSDAFQKLSF